MDAGGSCFAVATYLFKSMTQSHREQRVHLAPLEAGSELGEGNRLAVRSAMGAQGSA